MTQILKLGTRRSLLAMAQSRLVARTIERLRPGVTVELVGLDTRGDRQLDVPLSAIEGKEYFVAELDEALLTGTVDLTVHSLKDLSLERPSGIGLAAIPPRENPRDVILFAPDIDARLRAGKIVRIGTSSPRRVENLAPFLTRALPAHRGLVDEARIVTRPIRGNVDTRIGLLSLPDGNDKRVDGVVLALAGLNRLWSDAASRPVLESGLNGLRRMLLPLDYYPTAPGQGALAIECRADDESTRSLLEPLHCASTEAQVQTERALLAESGGGCHQRFGATRIDIDMLGSLTFVRGRLGADRPVAEIRWSQSDVDLPAPHWDGTYWRSDAFMQRSLTGDAPPQWCGKPGATFIAHSRALPDYWRPALSDNPWQRLWTSGTESWFRLAADGLWVEGCAEQLGFDHLRPTLESGVFGLPAQDDWHVLTHGDAAQAWPEQQVAVTYEVRSADPLHAEHPAVKAMRVARSIFWTSGSQYAAFRAWVPDGCRHACRYGRTWFYLREQALGDLTVFPSAAEWRRQAERCAN